MKQTLSMTLLLALAIAGCQSTPRTPAPPAAAPAIEAPAVVNTPTSAPAPAVSAPAPQPAAAEPVGTDAAFKKLAEDIYAQLQKLVPAGEKPRLAVYYFFTPPSRRSAVGEYIASLLPSFLSEAADGKIVIFTRRYLDQVLAQQGQQLSAAFDESKQVELGKLVGARYIVCGDIFAIQKRYELAVVLVDIETGAEKATVRGKLPRMKDLEGEANVAPLQVAADAPAEPVALGSPAAKMIEKGDHFYDQGRDAKALDVYLKVLRIDPEYPQVLFRLGYLYHRVQHAPAKALDFYSRYLKAAPKTEANHHKVFNNRGGILMAQGKLREAMADFNRAIEAKQDYADAYSNRAQCHVRLLGRNLSEETAQQAIADYGHAIKLKPQNADYRYNLGVLYTRLNKWDEAIAALTETVTLDGKHKRAYMARAGVYLNALKKYKLAEADLTKALAIDPEFNMARITRAIVRYQHLGDKVGAAADAKKYLEIAPNGRFAKQAEQIAGAAGQ